MEVFRQLLISPSNMGVEDYINILNKQATGFWKRQKFVEERETFLRASQTKMFCFAFAGHEPLPPALLWLAPSATNALEVANIVPRKIDKLSYSQYNAILESFVADVVQPTQEEAPADVEMTDAKQTIEDVLKEDAAAKFRAFSQLANRSTGSAHPSDRDRWLAFITTAHMLKLRVDAETLERLLIEEEKWPPDRATELAIEYDLALDLLRYYDGVRNDEPGRH